MKREKVVIFGATERAVLAHFYLTHDSPYEVVAFTVDPEFIKEETLCGLPVLPFQNIESIYPPSEYKMLVAIAFSKVNKIRAEKYYQAKVKGYELISYISSKASTWPGLVVGDNGFIQENVIIEAYTRVGNNVIMTAGASAGHHNLINDHCFVGAHAVILGYVTMEPYCILGPNCTIRDKIVIARECVIGAGALVLEDTQERGVYKGRPAELLPMPSNELRRI